MQYFGAPGRRLIFQERICQAIEAPKRRKRFARGDTACLYVHKGRVRAHPNFTHAGNRLSDLLDLLGHHVHIAQPDGGPHQDHTLVAGDLHVRFETNQGGADGRSNDLIAIAAFAGLAMIQNLWRPVLLARIDRSSDSAMAATVLSADSQAKSAFTMLSAPALGLTVDRVRRWSVGPFGVLTAGLLLLSSSRLGRRGRPRASQS
jgi:hypothetical protein